MQIGFSQTKQEGQLSQVCYVGLINLMNNLELVNFDIQVEYEEYQVISEKFITLGIIHIIGLAPKSLALYYLCNLLYSSYIQQWGWLKMMFSSSQAVYLNCCERATILFLSSKIKQLEYSLFNTSASCDFRSSVLPFLDFTNLQVIFFSSRAENLSNSRKSILIIFYST